VDEPSILDAAQQEALALVERAGLQPHMHAPAWGRAYQTFDHELTFPE